MRKDDLFAVMEPFRGPGSGTGRATCAPPDVLRVRANLLRLRRDREQADIVMNSTLDMSREVEEQNGKGAIRLPMKDRLHLAGEGADRKRSQFAITEEMFLQHR